MNDELRAEIRGYLQRELASGFAVRDEILESAATVFDDDGEPIDEAMIATLFDEVEAALDRRIELKLDWKRRRPPTQWMEVR